MVEVSSGSEIESSQATLVPDSQRQSEAASSEVSHPLKEDSGSSSARKRGFFRNGRSDSKSSGKSSGYAVSNVFSSDDDGDRYPLSAHEDRNGDWGIGDDVKMGLG